MASVCRIAKLLICTPFLVLVVLGSFANVFAASQTDTNSRLPVDLIRSIYEEFARGNERYNPDRFFTRALKDRYQKERRCEEKIQDQRNAGPLWWSGQDYKITNIEVTSADVNDKEQGVVARFKNFDEPQSRTFAFVKVGADWRIDDVKIGGRSLRAAMGAPCP